MPAPAIRPKGAARDAARATAEDRLVDEATVQLRDRGVVTLPKALRDRYGLTAGDALRVLDLDGVFVMTPLVPMVPELAREIERLRLEAGLSTEELLEGLRRERERYARERAGGEADVHEDTPDSPGEHA